MVHTDSYNYIWQHTYCIRITYGLHTNFISITYEIRTDYIHNISYILNTYDLHNITYALHMKYILFTYKLHTDYIQTTYTA